MADVEIVYEPITVNSGPVTVGVNGLDDIKLAVTQPVETSSAVTLSIPETVKADSAFTISVPETVKTDSAVKTDSRFELSIPEPVRTETKAAIDLEPVVVDQCLRLSLGPLPPTQVCLPNRQRLGLTLFGVEVFGLTLEGEARILLSDLPRPPHVVQVSTPAPAPHIPREDCDGGEPHPRAAEAATAAQPGQPFVVRLGR